MIRIDAAWFAVGPLDMRAGVDNALARVVSVFGEARSHHAYLFINKRANRMKVLVHDGFGLNNETDIASIRARLKELDAERDALTVCLERLASEPSSGANCKSAGASVTAASTAADKITLFRRLFAGRSDVFPVRWENRPQRKQTRCRLGTFSPGG